MNIKKILLIALACPLILLLIEYPTISKASNNSNLKNSEIIKQHYIIAQNNLTTKIKFKNSDGTEVFSLKPKYNGIKIENADDLEIARLTVDNNGKIKIKNPSDMTLGYVVSQNNSWKLKNANQTKTLFILRRQTDGHYNLDSGKDKAIYRIKRRNYGFEIETPQKLSLYKVKTKNNKLVLRDNNENIVIETSSNFSLIAMTCLGFDVLPQAQQIALAYALILAGK